MSYALSDYEQLVEKGFLSQSAQALPPQDAGEVLEQRPPRSSGLDDAGERSRYHRERHATRPFVALTPGQHCTIKALPLLEQKKRGRKTEFGWAAGEFAIYPRDYKAACRGDADAFMAVCELLEHIDTRLMKRKGELLVRGVSLQQIGLAIGKTDKTASRVMHRLQAYGVIKIFRIGKGQTNVYKLARYCNGAWTFPLGDHRSSARRIERRQTAAAQAGSFSALLAVGTYQQAAADKRHATPQALQELFGTEGFGSTGFGRPRGRGGGGFS